MQPRRRTGRTPHLRSGWMALSSGATLGSDPGDRKLGTLRTGQPPALAGAELLS